MTELEKVKREIKKHQTLLGKTVPFKKVLRDRILALILIELQADRDVAELCLPLSPSTISFLKRKALTPSIKYEDKHPKPTL